MLGVFAFTFFAHAQDESTESAGVEFIMEDWHGAVAQAEETGKFLMLDAYTDWCYWCKVQDKNTFANLEMAAFIEEKFVPLKVNMEEGIGVELAAKFRVTGFPTLLFFNEQGQFVSSVVGYIQDLDKFKEMLEEVLAIEEEQPYAFDSKVLNPGFPQWYIDRYDPQLRRSNPTSAETVNAFLEEQEDLFSEVSWSVMYGFNNDLNEKYKDHFLDNVDRYKEIYQESEVSDVQYGIVMGVVRKAVDEKNDEVFAQALAMVDQYMPEEESIKTNMKFQYYQATENWRAFTEFAMGLLEEQGVEELTGLCNQVAWTLYLKCEDAECLQHAAAWMEKVCEIAPDFAFIDTYAALLYKTGEYTTAKTKAEWAIEVGKEAGDDVSGTEELLGKIEAAIAGDDD